MPRTAENSIGVEGAGALARLLEPRRNADGGWSTATALVVLSLGGERHPPVCECGGGWERKACVGTLWLTGDFRGHAAASMGDEGMIALAGALEPRKDGSGHWVRAAALEELYLYSELPSRRRVVHRVRWLCCSTTVAGRRS